MTDVHIDLIFPRFKLLSGAERAILGLAEALAVSGHYPRIVCHQFDKSCLPRLASGVELVCTGRRLDWTENRYLNAVFDYGQVFQLGSSLNVRADICVLFGPALQLAWYFRYIRRSKSVVLYYCWEPPRVFYQDRELVLSRLGLWMVPTNLVLWLYRQWDRRLTGLVDGVCTSSQFSAQRILECYGRQASVITLGVDRSRLDQARRMVPDEPPILLTVNYLHPRKRVDLIIEALAVCAASGGPAEKARLVVVGDGPERSSLEQLVLRLGLDARVQFVGFVPDDELPRYYGMASCYVHAGLEESLGLSVIESLYCGKPVVAVDEAGIKETVEHGVTGYRVSATASGIAAGISQVLSRSDRGKMMGEAGHQQISARYCWEQGASDLLQVATDVKR